jgi:hypothetical protein
MAGDFVLGGGAAAAIGHELKAGVGQENLFGQ